MISILFRSWENIDLCITSHCLHIHTVFEFSFYCRALLVSYTLNNFWKLCRIFLLAISIYIPIFYLFIQLFLSINEPIMRQYFQVFVFCLSTLIWTSGFFNFSTNYLVYLPMKNERLILFITCDRSLPIRWLESKQF